MADHALGRGGWLAAISQYRGAGAGGFLPRGPRLRGGIYCDLLQSLKKDTTQS